MVVKPGAIITHWTWQGASTCSGGASAINWTENTSVATQSEQISLANINHQSGTTPSAYSFNFSRVGGAATITGFLGMNLAADPTENGFKFQRTIGATLINANHSQAGGTA